MAVAFDRREAILARIFAMLGEIAAANPPCFAYRDTGDIDPTNAETKLPQLPGLVLLDNKETPGISTKGHGQQSGGGLIPTVMVMEPQIYIALMPRDTLANAGVGEELSLWRMRVLKAIDQDDTLKALLGGNGEMSYDGLDSDMHADGPLIGQEAMKFSFAYTLNPREF